MCASLNGRGTRHIPEGGVRGEGLEGGGCWISGVFYFLHSSLSIPSHAPALALCCDLKTGVYGWRDGWLDGWMNGGKCG